MSPKGLLAVTAAALLVLLAPVAHADEGAPEVVTVAAPVGILGVGEADLTDTLTIVGANTTEGITFTVKAGVVHVTHYRSGPACMSTNPVTGGCDVQDPTGRTASGKEEFDLTDAEFTLAWIGQDFRGYITADPTYMRSTDASDRAQRTRVAPGGELGVPDAALFYDAAPLQAQNGWTDFPQYRANATDFRLQGTGGTFNLTGWFEVNLADAQFRLSGNRDGERWEDYFITTPWATEDAEPFRGTTSSPTPMQGQGRVIEAVVLEFGGDAEGNLSTDGLLAHHANGMAITERGGGLRYALKGAAAGATARGGDFLVEPQAVVKEAGATYLTLSLTPLAPLATAAPTDPEGDGVLDTLGGSPAATGVAVAGATAAVAVLAYYWPTLRYGLTALLAPLYTRIAKGEVLNHDTRDYIYNLIKSSPGIHAHEISARANIGWGTTVYHLKLLESHRMVVGKRTGRYKRFFVNDGRLSSKKEAYGILRNETSNRVAQYVLQHPGCNQKDLCEALDLKPSLVNWHMGKLEEAELVKKVKEGRTVRYYAGPAWSEMQVSGIAGTVPASAGAPVAPTPATTVTVSRYAAPAAGNEEE